MPLPTEWKKSLQNGWYDVLKEEFEKSYFRNLITFLEEEYRTETIFPNWELIFRAFELCPFEDVKVVILGQDPYHGAGEAHGLCFSVPDGIKMPPSLKNIFKALHFDLDQQDPENGNLERWAEQGVLLLNTVLTVRADKAGSHQKKGWEIFTDAVIKVLSTKKQGVVYLLWGAHALKKGTIIDAQNNLILQASHPSPLSVYRGFIQCRHFSAANLYLAGRGKQEIQW